MSRGLESGLDRPSRLSQAGRLSRLFASNHGALYAAILLALASCAAARADGPHIAFHGTQGAYTITLFSAPDPLVAGPADLTLLVQNAADGSLARVPAATGQLTLPGHAPVSFRLTPGGAANRQLPGATVRLPSAGTYALRLRLTSPTAATLLFSGTLPVEANHGRRNTVLWAVFLPVVLIALFLVNQYAKQLRRARRKAPPARMARS